MAESWCHVGHVEQVVAELHLWMLCRTVQDNAVFVPYGESIDTDMERIKYLQDMKGYCKVVMPRGLAVIEEDRGSLPDHLIEVSMIQMGSMLSTSLMG